MSVPAEVLQNILLQQQEKLKLIATLTQKFQLQDTGNSDSVDLAGTITEFTYDTATHLMHGSRDGTTLSNMNSLTKKTTGKSSYSYKSWVQKKTKGS